MPIKKQARFLKQYHSDLSEFQPVTFVDIIESLQDDERLKPILQVQFTLVFEEAQITGSSSEVRSLLQQIEEDDTPHSFNAIITTNTNPRKQLNISIAFAQKLVTFQINNTKREEAKPLLEMVQEKLPKSDRISNQESTPPDSTDLESREEVYLPGAFRPLAMPEPSEKDVFVIMSFQRQHRDAFNLAIEPTLKQLGFKAIRADHIQHNATVTPEIIRQIERSVFVVADLTGERPNVYYEVGYAHRANKEVILMVQKDSAVHFDVAAINRIQYEDYTELSSALKKRVRGIMERLEIALPSSVDT